MGYFDSQLPNGINNITSPYPAGYRPLGGNRPPVIAPPPPEPPPIQPPPPPVMDDTDYSSAAYNVGPPGEPGPGLGGLISNMIDERTNARLAQRNATVSPGLATPRSNIDAAYNDPSYRAQPGIPVEDRPEGVGLKRGGPIATAVDTIPNGPVGSARPDTFNTLARLDAIAARENMDAEQAQRQNMIGNQRAVAGYDAATAKRNAEVSRFVAQNGADMVLAPENSGYDLQRKAIIDTAKEDAAIAKDAAGKVSALDAAAVGANTRPYIAENAATQEELNRAQLASRAGAIGETELASRQLSLDQQKQLFTLQQQLAAETDPAKQKALQNKIAAINGKRTEGAKFAVIDVDTGQFETDIMGNKKPIYKKGVINTETGEIQSGAPEKGAPDPIAALKAMKPDEVMAMAKKAIEQGASVAEINKRLKAAGHKEI